MGNYVNMKKQLAYLLVIFTTTAFGQIKQDEDLVAFLPKGYVAFEKIYGELNGDTLKDCILIIKATDPAKIVTDEYGKIVDRNRRGIIILFNKKVTYEIGVKNLSCFSSENEDGGVYMPPDLSVEIKNGKIDIHYGHGRYGYWGYTFRFKNSDFELIGYYSGDRSNFYSEYVTFDETSINFITKKELVKEVINVDSQGKEIYKETWKDVSANRLLKLSQIVDFDELEMAY